MTRQLPVLVVENDPFLRLLGVILDPEHTDPQRIAAFSDFFAHDLPDFNGWLSQLRGRLKNPVDLVGMGGEKTERGLIAVSELDVMRTRPTKRRSP